MSLKKMAIFVEGYTESKFILKLLQEFFNKKDISVTIQDNADRTKCPMIRQIISADEIKFEILIFNSCTDNKVLSDLKERYQGLVSAGYSQFIGIRDLYPDFIYEQKEEAIDINEKILLQNSIFDTIFIFATMEVETWFIAETNHYLNINNKLTLDYIKNNSIDLSSISNFEKDIKEPAKKLNEIYKLVGLAYLKKDHQTTRTIDNLDYENLYLNVKDKIPSLDKLFDALDSFISN